MKKIYLFVITTILFISVSSAQAVTVTNPTNTTPNLAATYSSLANAITALNAITAISGPVTLTLNPGWAQTAPAGGYVIQFAATATAATPITITGNNQMITASSALTIGSLNDGIFKIIGADYITLQDFVMVESTLNTTTGGASPSNATTGNNMTEFGVALLRASPTDGPQHNTIRDNFIQLNKTYTNTFGVYSNSRASATAVATTSDITSITGSSFGNKIYSNTITNVNFGIVFNGSGVAAQMDDDNDIGGSSAFTGNTITNWGSAGTAVSSYPNITGSNYCIFVNQQTNDNISYNTIIGATHTTTNAHGGILKNYSLGQPAGTITSTISNNFITLTSSNGTSSMTVIQSTGLTALSTATININDNTIDDCAITGVTTTPNFIGISNSSAPGILNMNDNIIRGTTSTATTGGFTGLTNTGAVTTTINISNNQIGINSSNAVTFSNALNANIIAINNSSGTTATTLNMNNNIIRGLSGVSNAGVTYGISNSAVNSLAINISDNRLGNSSRNFITYTAASAGQVYGIINTGGGSTTNLTITNNKVDRINGVSFSNIIAGITNSSGLIGGTLNFNNNALGTTTGTFLTTTAASTGIFYAMWNSNGATTATLNMNNNTVDGFFLHSTTVNLTVMACNGASIGTANANNNSFGSTGTLINFSAVQGSTFRVIDLGAGSSNAAATVACQNNTIRGITYTATGTSTFTGIYLNSAPLSVTISGNQFNNLSLNTTGDAYLIYDQATRASGETMTITNNSVVTAIAKTASSGDLYGILTGGSSVNGSVLNITNNTMSNMSALGSSGVFPIMSLDGASNIDGPTETVTGNTVSSITAGSGSLTGINVDYAGALTCSSNTISNLNTSGNINGIYFGTNNGAATHIISNNTISGIASTGGGVSGMVIQGTSNYSSVNVHSNQVSGLSASGTSFNLYGIYFVSQQVADIHDNVFHNFSASGSGSVTVYGIFSGFGATVNIYSNKVYDIVLTGTPTSGSLDGIFSVMSTTAYNNFIADLRAPSLNGFPGVRGFYYAAFFPGTFCNFYHNSIYLNANSTGTDFGSAAFMTLANTDPTVGMLTMIDNILVNTSTSTGTGKTAAFYRIGSNLSNFSGSSDYNLLYAGTPGASNLIYYDTTNLCQTLTTYQAVVSTRDANSISLMPTFVSSTDLHLTSANCRIDGRGTPVASVTTDIDGAARNVTTPDIGADEFTATTSTTLAGVAGSAVCEDRTVAVTGTTFTSNACDPIASVLPSGADPVAGKVNVCVTLDATQQTFNGEPYVQRHFDIEPTTSNQTTTSATITLYFTDAEFDLYNTTNPVVWPRLPTVAGGANADPNRANLKVTQFHGAATTSPSSPGNYPGIRVLIDPLDANVFWNGSYWEVTFNVAGFSGFYVHTNNYNAPLPVVVNYLTGRKQGGNHLLNWKVTCTSTPRATMTLERSSDARNYSGLYTITADAARCQQPFDYTDTDPLKGMNYYRLKIVDADGHITYSTTVALLNAVKGFDMVSIAPNPVVSNNFKLNVASAQSGKMEFVIFDMQGRLVNRQTISLIAGFNSIPVNVANLAPGTYTIKGSMADDQTKVIRFVKQ